MDLAAVVIDEVALVSSCFSFLFVTVTTAPICTLIIVRNFEGRQWEKGAIVVLVFSEVPKRGENGHGGSSRVEWV